MVWEYRVWDHHFESDGPESVAQGFIELNLNLPGKDGWELVAAVPYVDGDKGRSTSGIVHYFKRPKVA
jgi:hypothetical protein